MANGVHGPAVSLLCGTVLIAVVLAMLALAPPPARAQGIAPDLPIAAGPENTLGTKSDPDIWRALRQGAAGRPTTVSPGSGVLVNARGVWWSNLRRPDGPLIRYGGYGLVAVTGLLLLFFLIRRRIGYGEDSGRLIERFGLSQRLVHWSNAVLFILMAVSGLLLLFGRPYVSPYIGKGAYSAIATGSIQTHNLLGLVSVALLVVLFFAFVRGNIPKLHDLRWILRGGGFFGRHASAGRYNFGEKLWFWTVIIAGIALSISGVLMLFPEYLASRDTLQLSELIHAIAALIFIGYALGHIYLGTIGTRGSLRGMVNGTVDENWARMHHDLWLEQELGQELETETELETGPKQQPEAGE